MMKNTLFLLICMISVNGRASIGNTNAGQLIDEKGAAYGFGQTIIINKAETKEFSVTGLYNGFYAQMTCKAIIVEPCSSIVQISKEKPKKSAYIITSNINGNNTSSQTDYQCSDYGLNGYNGCYYGNSGWKWCHKDETVLQNISFSKVINGSSFKILNRPEFSLKFICTAE